MSEYQLEIKQVVDYPRCRIYRKFIQALIEDQSIRLGGSSDLFYYTVLCSYANFRTSNKRIDGISYTIYPGEWLCRISELAMWFRTRFQHQAVSILQDLQERHLITYSLLGRGKLVKFKIRGWQKHNRVLDYNAPCAKDTGFFFLPVSIANELLSQGRCSEMDVLLDLWINTVYNDEQVQGSDAGPVVYLRNGTGSPLLGYTELAQRWGVSKATVGRYLGKLRSQEYISVLTFPGAYGSVICPNNYLSTMFEVSDVMVDKDEIAMLLHIGLTLPEDIREEEEYGSVSVSGNERSVSNPYIAYILQKVEEVLAVQGFSCFFCPKIQYKLLPLSPDCEGEVFHISGDVVEFKALLVILCGESQELFRFELRLLPEVDRR